MGTQSKSTYQEMRKGSSKLLKTLIIKLSLVTHSIGGPGNCPFINIPCQYLNKNIKLSSQYQHQKIQESKTERVRDTKTLLR